jgi:RNA polymerase sigma-70 factor (ECF subfamily)
MPLSTSAIHTLLPASLTQTQTVAEASVVAPARVVGLTRLLAAGDQDTFREFHELYFDRLYQFALVVTQGDEHEAQEVLQETLLRVLRYARVFETEEVFWCWLKVLARSAAHDRGRKRRRYLSLLQRFASLWGDPAQESIADEDHRLQGLLEESLGELSPADRRLVEGKYLEGSAVRELSIETGLTDKAVESRLLRLRRQLRESLLKKLHEP